MARPRRDGTPAREPNRRKLTALFLQKLKPPEHPYLIWDQLQRGLVLSVRPSGRAAFKVIYGRLGRVRWYHLGDAQAIGLKNARELARRIMYQVAEGKDPQAERKAQRSSGTFEDLASRYVEEYAKKNNKSWSQADALVHKHLLPKWGKLRAADIVRGDVKAMMARIGAPIVANQVLAAASAIFAWSVREEVGGIRVNPCVGVERNPVRSRERVLTETELPLFWTAFEKAGLQGVALKLILLLGQRPGEVIHMRSEHLDGGWWKLPGDPIPSLGWPGTKNAQTHRVWMPKPAAALLLGELSAEGFLLADRRGHPVGKLDVVMRNICADLGVAEKVTPHDLRRTHGTMITALGFGRDAMNRIQNHREGGIADTYDRHKYEVENQTIMEAVASRIITQVEGGGTGKVVAFAR